jgi:AraC-like DNA-binding protein
VAGLLLGALARPLAALPEPVAGAIHELFGAPHRFPSVADLASAAGVSVRHLQRLTTAVGFTRPAELLVVARVMRAHQLLQSPGMTLEGAAARVRVEARILSRHVRRTTGETRAMALRHLSPSALVTHCTRTLYRPPAALARAAGDRPGGA